MHENTGAVLLHVTYVLMLLASIIIAIVAAASSDWIHRDDQTAPDVLSFEAGPYRYCTTDATDDQNCQDWGGDSDPDDIPGDYWQATAILFAISIAILIICLILTVITFWCCYVLQRPQAVLVLTASALIVAALFLFGAGLEETKEATGEAATNYGVSCGLDAEKYERDECDLGSGGALAITAVVLTFITSIIGCFIRPDKEHYV